MLLVSDQPNRFYLHIYKALKKEGQETYVIKTKKNVSKY